jgi:dTDP-4-dehydrorhamnose reductase
MPAPVILVVGRDGQVGHALVPALSPLGRVVAVSRAECDLSDEQAIARAIDATKPDVIVNAAAYTAVDRAECDRAAAFALNATAPGILATLAEERGAILIHYSTDYVFDGAKPTPYCEDDVTNPQSVYGASKRDGEVAVRRNLARHFILRTSWVFSDHGTNFLKTTGQ